MAILSALKRKLSQVFAGSPESDEEFDIEQTQATGTSSDSNVANSITFVEGLNGPRRTEADSGLTEPGALQDPEDDGAAAKIKIESDTQGSNIESLTFSQAIDDEEWASGLCGEDIEAGTQCFIVVFHRLFELTTPSVYFYLFFCGQLSFLHVW